MEEDREQEGNEDGLEDGYSIPDEVLQEKVPMEVLMHYSIPLSIVLIEVGGIPKVLIELSISKSGQLSIEIRGEIESDEKRAQK